MDFSTKYISVLLPAYFGEKGFIPPALFKLLDGKIVPTWEQWTFEDEWDEKYLQSFFSELENLLSDESLMKRLIFKLAINIFPTVSKPKLRKYLNSSTVSYTMIEFVLLGKDSQIEYIDSL